ncbi:MAG TPA: DUF4259 domain-containing protein [Terriglobales bacterium]|nr:DUF4259 domain-containing protein [Terriglobales bacterium]
MGAWGSGSFENDDAANWLAELGTIAPDDLTKIFNRAADDPTYFEAPGASVAVAAAEVVAALNGAPAQAVPPEIVRWTTNRPAPTPELKALALRALDRVRKNSELKDLWLEADGLNDWTTAIQDLQTRVGR